MTISRSTITTLAVALAGFGASTASASAASPPQHLRRTVGPLVLDAPAGMFCDFAFHGEESYRQNLTRFFDDAGDLVRVEDQVDLTIFRRNVETGTTLTEHDHYAAHVDLVDGTVSVTGQSWHVRNADGRLVLSGAGFTSFDPVTGDVFRETPHESADICAALA